MIQRISLHSLVKDRRDFDLLVRLFEKLGLRREAGAEGRDGCFQEFLPSFTNFELIHYKQHEGERFDVGLTISDPDSAYEIAKGMGLQVLEIKGRRAPSDGLRCFRVQLPGGTEVRLVGFRDALLNGLTGIAGGLSGEGKRFGIVVSRFNSFITERLLSGAVDGLLRCGVEPFHGWTIVRVPGAFEIPSAARSLAETKIYNAVLCIGCLLRGDTAHYDVIVNEVTRGIGQSAQETGIPHAFGVLTCDTLEQAIDRAGLKMGNKGFEAALAAVEMANLKVTIGAGKGRAKSSGNRVSGKAAAKKRLTRKNSTRTRPGK